MRPLIVVEASPAAVAHARHELKRKGWRVIEKWRGNPDVVCAGVVASETDAAGALLAAIAGAGLLVEGRADRDVLDRLVEDLRRLGEVDHRTREPQPEPALTHEERELVALLGEGVTVGDAARRLHLSRRTADRRLATARARLGASSTAELLVAARRLRLGA